VILFLFLTQPIAAHMIARAGYRTDVPLWEGSVTDELAAAESASRIEDPSGL
jgi:multicomponent Na+:H+ antiporter subunit G